MRTCCIYAVRMSTSQTLATKRPPAADRVIPRVAPLWVQTTARTMYDALEGRL